MGTLSLYFLSSVCYIFLYLIYFSTHHFGAVIILIVCPFALQFCIFIMLNMNWPHTAKEREALLWNGFLCYLATIGLVTSTSKKASRFQVFKLKGWKLCLPFFLFFLAFVRSQTLKTSAFGVELLSTLIFTFQVKLCDFGFSRIIGEKGFRFTT